MSDDTTHADPAASPEPSAWSARLAQWEEGRRTGPIVRATERFFSIGGLDLGALIAVELFTTVLPILLIAFAWFEHFSADQNVGELLLDQLGIHGSLAGTILSEFSNASGLHRLWNVVGIASFMFWGIPMSITVSRMFAEAWQRPVPPILQRLWRGTVWFVLYVATLLVNHFVSVHSGSPWVAVVLWPITIVASIAFWGTSPLLLAEGVPRTRRVVIVAGITGTVITLFMRMIVIRIVFPLLLSGWNGFGPIGVAFTLMTWCGVNGVAWVAIACAGAVFAEREGGRPSRAALSVARIE